VRRLPGLAGEVRADAVVGHVRVVDEPVEGLERGVVGEDVGEAGIRTALDGLDTADQPPRPARVTEGKVTKVGGGGASKQGHREHLGGAPADHAAGAGAQAASWIRARGTCVGSSAAPWTPT